MSGNISEDGDAGFQIAPMVDVVFVLLLFFMASAGSQVVEKELSIQLPSGRSAAKAAELPPAPIFIDIAPDGAITANKKKFDSPESKDLPELRMWLKETMSKFGNNDPVILRPDAKATHARVMDVLNAAIAVGVTKLTFGG